MARKRRQLAAESLAIDIPGADCPLHQAQTFEFANAFDEKLRRSRKLLARYADRDSPDETVNFKDSHASVVNVHSEVNRHQSSKPPRAERVRGAFNSYAVILNLFQR